jgi:hypothetical protein
MSEERLTAIETTLQVVVQQQAKQSADIGELRRDMGELRNHMGVLFEEALGQIRDMIPPPDPIPRASHSEFVELRADINNELVPLKRVVSEHSAAIDRLERKKRQGGKTA